MERNEREALTPNDTQTKQSDAHGLSARGEVTHVVR